MDAAAAKSKTTTSLTYRAVAQVSILIGIYIILLLVLPSDSTSLNSHHLSMIDYKLIRLAIAIPSLLVWLVAFVAYAALRQYALALQGAPEAEQFENLATASAWLAWSLPLTAIISLMLGSLAYRRPGLQSVHIITTNYVDLILPLVAFSLMALATRDLIRKADLNLGWGSARAIIILFMAGGLSYCYFTFSHFNLSSLSSTDNAYSLPIWLLVLTIIIPYLYVWFVGLLAAYEITFYSQKVPGLIYQRALQLLAGGIATIIVSSIAVQYLNGITPRTSHVILGYRLIFNVLFRITGGVGFVLMTLGSLRLRKIEEI